MRVHVLNVKYTPNLGDGVIADCLEHAIGQAPGVDHVESCDLAGRTAYGTGLNKSRGTVRTVLSLIPVPLRQLALCVMLELVSRLKLSAHYKQSLSLADAILIGGGQLIADKDLNFPRKINAALNAAQGRQTANAVYGVGVAKSFTKKGLSLFKKAFSGRLAQVRCRDTLSVTRWDSKIGEPSAQKVWDPGFLMSELYPSNKQAMGSKPLIGVGVTHPETLMLHADPDRRIMNEDDWLTFYRNLVLSLLAKGADVELFTNGAFDDQEFAQSILEACTPQVTDGQTIILEPTAATPGELSLKIASFDGLIAHRLHANIVAFSYAVPHVGLGWDSKMQGFFSETERDAFLVTDVDTGDADRVSDLMFSALSQEIDAKKIAAIQGEIHKQVVDLIAGLKVTSFNDAEPD